MAEKQNLLNYGRAALLTWLGELGEPRYRATQLIQWIHQRGVVDWSQMTNLSRAFRDKLAQVAVIETPVLVYEQVASDGTCKWLLKLADSNAIEAVYIPEPTRATLCVSSQVGCALNCSFCATGKQGFNRNLSVAEIIGQVWFAVRRAAAQNWHPITNVVMMGMGEPLLNYDAVLPAMDLMLDDNAYGLSKYRVTLSTAGVIPGLMRLRQESPVALAISLHAPFDELRNELVPLNRKYPLSELMAVCRSYFPSESKRSVTFEYVMLAGINDTLACAKALVTLVKGMACKINLIPFNGFADARYQRSSDAAIQAFQQHLMAAGVATWVRKTRGRDIEGACGQLAGDFKDRTGRHARWIRTGRLVPVA